MWENSSDQFYFQIVYPKWYILFWLISAGICSCFSMQNEIRGQYSDLLMKCHMEMHWVQRSLCLHSSYILFEQWNVSSGKGKTSLFWNKTVLLILEIKRNVGTWGKKPRRNVQQQPQLLGNLLHRSPFKWDRIHTSTSLIHIETAMTHC